MPSTSRVQDLRFAVSLSCLAIIGCGGTPTVPNTVLDFAGTVTDAATGAPIAGASVSTQHCGFSLVCANTANATTDAQGHYAVHARCLSDNWLAVFAAGYQASQREVRCEQTRQTGDFALTKSP